MIYVMQGKHTGRYEVTGKETAWEGRYLRCVKLTYEGPGGVQRRWEAMERVNCHGIVVIVPITEEGEAVLIRQFRPPVNSYVVEFPAGLNDRGEEIEEAAARELLEETGYRAREMFLLTKGPLSSGSSSEILTAFLAKGLNYAGVGQRDETEDIEVLKIPLDVLYDRLALIGNEGDLVDLKIYGLIELAKRRL
jgi:ADP-ribose pyrophosphatase